MFTGTESTAVFLVVFAAIVVLTWSYNRSKVYGKLGILAWLQSVVLMAPWLIFFGLFAVGIYLSLVGVLALLLVSIGIYIWIGKKLRAAGQNLIIQQKAAARIEAEEESESASKVDLVEESDTVGIVPIPNEDLIKIKGIFGIDTFFSTETIPYQEGAIFKGNLRGEAAASHQKMSDKLQAELGEKYRLFLVDSPEEKPIVVVLPSKNDPPKMTLAQKNLALVLVVATIVTSLEAAGLLLGFDLSSNLSRYPETISLSLGLWSVLIAHEIGHWLLAKRHNIQLSLPFFLPSWQIGAFGAITRFETLLPNRTVFGDIALAGPALGGLVSLVLLIIGMTISHPGSILQIPTEFFQASVLVGGLGKIILGSALEESIVDVDPLVIVGWLGLVITALNMLPAGKLDGGRVVHAIYGRQTARRATVATLIILGILSLANPGNPIPLYWAILIIFLQRDLERPTLNEITEPDDKRAAWALLGLFLMLLILIPFNHSLAGNLGIGG